MPGDAVGVLVVDDQQPFRGVAAAVVARSPGFVLAGEAETGEAAVAATQRLRPGLVLMDVRLPGINGVEAARRIVDADPGVVVLLCSTYPVDELPAEVAAATFAEYVHKAQLRPEVLRRAWARAQLHGDPAVS